ncbi:MAG: hypothetical protein A2X11_12780 [Bacteroidetes bacterium GWE2_42_24]|nr:MAG: hypothetical protein A2X11_12780 [Bacteroidetes bacterium GWE2_42_24]OFY32259.1 MAG: hypothetical protein A2X09_13800 [Bacteroidetes bacterium GWF2_43_11]
MKQEPDFSAGVFDATGSMIDCKSIGRKALLPLLICEFMPLLSLAGNTELELLRAINTDRNPFFDGFFKVITDSAPVLSFMIPALLIVFLLVTGNKQQALTALIAGVSVGIAALISTILKFWIDRPRPFITYEFIEKLSVGGSPSFPSGHTTDAFALAIVLALMFRKWWVIVPLFLWAALVGYSRMHLGVHYPSDVGAGMVIGLLAGGLSFVGLKRVISWGRLANYIPGSSSKK